MERKYARGQHAALLGIEAERLALDEQLPAGLPDEYTGRTLREHYGLPPTEAASKYRGSSAGGPWSR
ncbi:hypothetical protein P3T36_007571 [Kitasatospora sp. MAP12-15]|uniref:hypothetical protein n=1 Tax=unclassified Kitasatospora TaxID=2633591 RepID=UPI00247300BD|nr:hypothetical protein [Kitasatospora sp. MAP12-44]MDH6114631.1 hypothetical protein [Kitasatospora sp. MAP12-44]